MYGGFSQNGENDHAARSQAILTFSALVGAMVLARALTGERLSREILKTVAQLLNDPLRKGTSATSLR
jgi:TetR/AcrR family transcriptional repressor of nem operon